MSIAAQLREIADNVPKVYQAGFDDGAATGGGGGEDALQYAERATFPWLNKFGKKEIEIYIPNVRVGNSMFVPSESNTTVEHITLIGGDEPTLVGIDTMFNMNWLGGPLKHITFDIDFSNVKTSSSWFNNHSAIVTIDGRPLNFSSLTNTLTFSYLSLLEYIRFAPATMKQSLNMSACKSLSNESIQSVIDGLADLTGAGAKTLTFHADVGNKLTQAQKDAISAKNWTLAY